MTDRRGNRRPDPAARRRARNHHRRRPRREVRRRDLRQRHARPLAVALARAAVVLRQLEWRRPHRHGHTVSTVGRDCDGSRSRPHFRRCGARAARGGSRETGLGRGRAPRCPLSPEAPWRAGFWASSMRVKRGHRLDPARCRSADASIARPSTVSPPHWPVTASGRLAACCVRPGSVHVDCSCCARRRRFIGMAAPASVASDVAGAGIASPDGRIVVDVTVSDGQAQLHREPRRQAGAAASPGSAWCATMRISPPASTPTANYWQARRAKLREGRRPLRAADLQAPQQRVSRQPPRGELQTASGRAHGHRVPGVERRLRVPLRVPGDGREGPQDQPRAVVIQFPAGHARLAAAHRAGALGLERIESFLRGVLRARYSRGSALAAGRRVGVPGVVPVVGRRERHVVAGQRDRTAPQLLRLAPAGGAPQQRIFHRFPGAARNQQRRRGDAGIHAAVDHAVAPRRHRRSEDDRGIDARHGSRRSAREGFQDHAPRVPARRRGAGRCSATTTPSSKCRSNSSTTPPRWAGSTRWWMRPGTGRSATTA